MNRRGPTRSKTSLLAVVAFAALCLVPAILAAPPTSASIVEGASMGKVRLLMKKHAVLAAFGKPAWCLELSTGTVDCSWLTPPQVKVAGLPKPLNFIGAVTVRFWKGAATEIHVMAPDRARPEYRNVPLLTGWRTTKGIGLGSSTASVRAAYGPSLKQANYSAGMSLELVSKRGGRRVETWFQFGPSAQSVREIIVLTPAV